MPKMTWDPKVTLGNVLTILTMLGVVFASYITLKLDVQASAAAIAALQTQVDPLVSFPTRLAVVERNQVTGKEQREAFQDQATIAFEDLRKQNLQILTQLSAIVARLEAQDRRP